MKTTIEDLAILRLPEVMRLVGLAKSTIYQMIKDDRFPRRVHIGSRAVGWRSCDIHSWLQAVSLAGAKI